MPFLALAEFKYQNLFNWSSCGGLVKWFVSGLLLLLMLLQRPTLSLSLGTHVGVPHVAVSGCCGAAQELWQEAGGVGLVGINAAGWKTGLYGDGTFPLLPCVFLWPVCLQGPPVSPQLRGQTYMGSASPHPLNMAPETDVAQGKKHE